MANLKARKVCATISQNPEALRKMASKTGLLAARVVAVILPLLTLSVLSFGQNDNNQGNEDNYPVVPASHGGIRPHAWVNKKLGPNAAQPATGILNPTQLTTA